MLSLQVRICDAGHASGRAYDKAGMAELREDATADWGRFDHRDTGKGTTQTSTSTNLQEKQRNGAELSDKQFSLY